MKAATVCLVSLFVLAVASTPAAADLVFTFNTGFAGSGNFGTVTLHQDGSDVDVTVSLNPPGNESLIQTGTHETFTFDLADKNLGTNGVTVPAGFTWLQAGSGTPSEQGNPAFTGPFDYQINCNSDFNNCTSPGTANIPGFAFTVHGVVISDFVKAADGTYFSADIFDGNLSNGANTGVVGVTGDPRIITTPTPEPASLALLGTGLAAMAGVLRRKLRK
jgi:hypothetical protein